MKKINESKTLEYYLNKHYPFIVYPADEGGYVAEIEELPGCITEGDTVGEAVKRIEEARRAWIEIAYEDGMEIALPRTEQEYSGKFVLRLPKYLHRHLAEQATHEGVSLNQYVVALLSGGVANYQLTMKQAIDRVALLLEPFHKTGMPERTHPNDSLSHTWDLLLYNREPSLPKPAYVSQAETKQEVLIT